MSAPNKRKLNAGIILIAVGVGLYLLERTKGIGQEVVFLVIGGVFLISYFIQKKYGLLIPACILLGLGVGSASRGTFLDYGNSTLIGLGLGFIAVFVIARIYEGKSQWWPLIPGGVMLLVAFPETARLFEYITNHWPLTLVIIGILILIGAFRGGEE